MSYFQFGCYAKTSYFQINLQSVQPETNQYLAVRVR